MRLTLRSTCLALATLLGLASGGARAAVFTVTTTADSGLGSLRNAILAANLNGASDTIVFAPELAGQTIRLTTGYLLVDEFETTLTISAASLPGGITISGTRNSRVFEFYDGASVVLDSLTITDGMDSFGGGIYSEASLTLRRCLVTRNIARAINGGGLYQFRGFLTVEETTFAHNLAIGSGEASGGAVYLASATAEIINSTFSGNTALAAPGTARGGALRQDGGGLSIRHSTFVNNRAQGNSSYGGAWFFGGIAGVSHAVFAGNTAGTGPDLYTGLSTISSEGHNFVGNGAGSFGFTNGVNNDRVGTSSQPLDPLLGPLQFHGGATPTHAPLAASPLIDSGSSSNLGFTTDQRRLPRLVDGRGLGAARLDIGAVEAGPALYVTTARDDADGLHAGGLSLREALANVSAPGTRILFDSAAFASPRIELDPLKGPLVVRSGVLAIDASALSASLVLDGRNATRILEISNNAALTLAHLQFVNGRAATGAGLRCAAGSTVSLADCSIESCVATNNGGAIASGGRLSLHGCQLLNNTSLRGSGGALDNSGGIAAFTDCTISDNSAASRGGGLHNTAGGRMLLQQCAVQHNSASTGGGIYNGNTNAEAVLRFSTIVHNASTQAGGGVVNSNSLNATHTLIACNRRGALPDDFAGAAVSEGFNFLGASSGSSGFTSIGDVTNLEAHLHGVNFLSGIHYTPELASPATDAGFNTAGNDPDELVFMADLPARDLLGAPRVANGSGAGLRPDIGATELQLQLPFSASATPWPLPGRIEAENFDAGGPGLGYSDTTPANVPGAYRPDDGVDVEPALDDDGGFNVTAPASGEWLQYTVDVRAAGRYTLLLRVATDAPSGALRVEIDGRDLTGLITIADTGGEQDWITLARRGLELPAGRHILRLTWGAGAANLNWMEWQSEDGERGLTRLLYLSRGGALLSDFYPGPRGQANFPASPEPFGATALESGRVAEFETPPDLADSYGVILAGHLAPSLSGWYSLYLCSDNEGELWLSTDDNPANSVLVATEPEGNLSRNWVNGTGRPVVGDLPSNISAPVYLEAGRRYYVEAIAKEGDGVDNLAVTWQRAGDPAPTNGAPPIGGAWLRPWLAQEPFTPAGPAWLIGEARILPSFQTLNPAQPSATVTFRVVANTLGPVGYEWLFNGQPLAGTNFSGTNSAVLKIMNPTPALAGLYSVILRGPSATNVAPPAVLGVQDNASPDTILPTLAVTSPASAVVSTASNTFTLSGRAADNRGVLAVLVSSGGFTNVAAIGATNWSFATALNLGTNRFLIRAVDAAGNLSAVATRSIVRPDTNRLDLLVAGQGTVSPNLTNAPLFVGRTYRLTATPRAGHVFSHWSGDAASPSNVLNFVMRPGLRLTANFVPNPFAPRKGSYTGLFYQTNEVLHESSGLVTATVTELGALSGKVLLAGKTLPFSGRFNLNGITTLRVPRAGRTPLTLELRLPAESTEQFFGGLTDGAWVSELLADRAVFSTTNHAPYDGKYTMLLPSTGEPGTPGGDSFGAPSVSLAGKVTFSGVLADGTAFSQSAPVARGGEWPFYAPLYSGKGSIIGWLTFDTNGVTESLRGLVNWTKPPLPAAKVYPGGFIASTWATGSTYAPGTNRVLTFSNGVVQLTGGNLAASPLPFNVGLTAANKIIHTNGTALTMTITTANGLFSGTFKPSPASVPLTFRGAVLQQTNLGSGFFLNGGVSGGVSFHEAP